MKKRDCIFYHEVVEGYRRQTGEDTFTLEPELIDEVCYQDPEEPKHHDEYDCEGCPFYEKESRFY